MRVAFVSGPYESLGLEYLSSMLIADGHTTKLFVDPCLFRDDAVYTKNKWFHNLGDFSDVIVEQIKQYKPDVVGMSVVTDYYDMSLKIAQKIKKQLSIPIVFGGVHPSAVPERVLNTELVDYVCVGEGEYAFCELVQALTKGTSAEHIKNIWSRNDKGISRNELRPLISDLDSLPFPDKKLYAKESSFFRHTYTCMTSRGCFFDCSYCFNSHYRLLYKNKGQYFRRRSVGNVIDELSAAMRLYPYSSVRFADDIFNHDKQWLENFFKAYRQHIKKPFDCQLWLDTVDEDTALILKESGCYLVEIGIQSFSEKVREEVLGRFYKNTDIKRSIECLKKQGIRVLCENIYGLPGQKIEHVKASLKFYAQENVLSSFYGLRFYPKTRIVNIALERNILNSSDIDEIEGGKKSRLFTYGGDSLTKDFKRIHRWLLLTYLMPNRFLLPHFDRIFDADIHNGIVVTLEKMIVIFRCRPFMIALRRIMTRITLYIKFIILKLRHLLKMSIL